MKWISKWVTAAFLVGCASAPNDKGDAGRTNSEALAAKAPPVPTDGLADAFSNFVDIFTSLNFDAQFQMSYAFNLGLVTDKVKGADGQFVSGQATLDMNTGDVTATLNHAPATGNFELWMVKNVTGGTVAPEATDQMLKIGKFSKQGAFRTLTASLGTDVAFDMDLLVVTRAGKTPDQSVVAVGDRTLFEKRLFRFRQGKGLDPVTGAVANNVETIDPLVARGAQLFFNETFGGNGRTCGTCHRAERSLTIDPDFIATLPQSDPLFVAETNPALAKLEDPQLLRSRSLILENVDGFDDPKHKFVMRGVPHTLSLGLTNGISNAFGGPPDHRLGWAGDGGPGRSTLHEFTFGAIMQHFTKTLARKPGVDFRIPTEEELDALEAFQLFNGRQLPVDFSSMFPTDPHALNGSSLFFNTGCTSCHSDLFGFPDFSNPNFDTGVANLTPDLPADDGFLSPGDHTFNVPPLVEAADTPPFFHNNAMPTIEDAVGFYFSPTFQASPSSFFIFNQLSSAQQADIAAFLRVVNAFANISQVRKRVAYIQSVRSDGNTDLLNVAISDTNDAENDLAQKDLNPDIQTQIGKAEKLLVKAQADSDANRPAEMKKILTLLDGISAALFTSTPPNGSGGFGAGGFGAGGSIGEGGASVGGTFAAGGFGVGGSGIAGSFSEGGAAGEAPGVGGSSGIGGSIIIGGSGPSSGGASNGFGGAPGTGGTISRGGRAGSGG
jgi:hypothetical protein